jgi:hypothetical protein
MLIRSIEGLARGEAPPMLGTPADARRLCGPVTVDMVGSADGWRTEWQLHDQRRRTQSAWASAVPA